MAFFSGSFHCDPEQPRALITLVSRNGKREFVSGGGNTPNAQGDAPTPDIEGLQAQMENLELEAKTCKQAVPAFCTFLNTKQVWLLRTRKCRMYEFVMFAQDCTYPRVLRSLLKVELVGDLSACFDKLNNKVHSKELIQVGINQELPVCSLYFIFFYSLLI